MNNHASSMPKICLVNHGSKDYGCLSVEMLKGSIPIVNKQTYERLSRLADENPTLSASAVVSDGFNDLR